MHHVAEFTFGHVSFALYVPNKIAIFDVAVAKIFLCMNNKFKL